AGTQLILWDCLPGNPEQDWAATTTGNTLPTAQPDLPLGVSSADFPAIASPGDVNGDGNPDLYAISPTGQIWEYPGAAPAGGSAQFAAPLSVGYLQQPTDRWKLSDTTDSSAGKAAYGLTLGGSAAFTTDPSQGTVLSLNGSSAYASALADPAIDTSKSYTVSAWVKPNDLSTSDVYVAQAGSNGSGLQLYYSSWSHSWAFGRDVDDSTADTFNSAYGPTTGPTSPQVGTWTHLVGVYDASTQQLMLYVNGTLVSSAPYTGTAWDAAGSLQIGRRIQAGGTGGPSGNASISDVQLYNTALDPAGVSAITAGQPTPVQLS
ncbi:LamG domain-containing protein, partial [Kitasatospora sp. NPDC052896]|uniref:LamG domain-containing protein n=1 Tax=Kitasatospora sp. NPDC052896 TaxID=3364061 RepID=UPI0037C50323